MLGFASWVAAGAIALLLARLIRVGRPAMWIDLMVALMGSIAAGMAATALDFGGWAEPDPRAFTFALLSSLAVLGLARTVKLLTADY